MFSNNKILAVIPAIGDDGKIPRKYTRLLGDKPLIAHILDTLKTSEYVDDIVVLTDDNDISRISELCGVTPFKNFTKESNFETRIFETMLQREKAAFDEYDIIMVVKPNAPFITVDSINRIIEKFDNPNLDTVISVKEDRHLRWGLDEENNRFFPLNSHMVNGNGLMPEFVETRAIVATRRQFISKESIFGNGINLNLLQGKENILINDIEDLWIAEKHVNKKKIVIVVNGFDEIGLGHVRRCLAIAHNLISHDVTFISKSNHPLGIEAILSNNYPCFTYDDSDEIFDVIEKLNPDLIINDILDTSFEYISKLIDNDYFVINFEDVGPGIEIANLVFNPLSDYGIDLPNVFTGYKYYILEDEFYFQKPKVVTEDVNNVFMMFLGNDPNNLTEKTLQALISSGFTGNIDVLLGVGHPNKEEILNKYDIYSNVVIYQSVRSISEFIAKADIIFTSADRTVFDICSIGVPCICICQDERELANTFANNDNGFINLGLAEDITSEDIINQFNSLVSNFDLRLSLSKKMLSINLKDGFTNVWQIVRKFYSDFKYNDSL